MPWSPAHGPSWRREDAATRSQPLRSSEESIPGLGERVTMHVFDDSPLGLHWAFG